MAKVMISLDDELLKRIDDYADNNYMSRSGLVSLATTQYLNANDTLSLLNDLTLAVKKIADEKQIDDALLEQIRDYERMAKLIVNK